MHAAEPVCSKSDRERKAWRGRTCRLIAKAAELTDSFKDHPDISEDVITKYKEFTEHFSKTSEHAKKLEELWFDCSDKLNKCCKEKARLEKIKTEMVSFLVTIDSAITVNKKSSTRREFRPFEEKRIDCPLELLELEKKKLKEIPPVLRAHMKAIDDQRLVINSIQYRIHEFSGTCQNFLKVVSRRYKKSYMDDKVKAFYCIPTGMKIIFTDQDLEQLQRKSYYLGQNLDEILRRSREVSDRATQVTEDISKKKAWLHDCVNMKLKEKVNHTNTLTESLVNTSTNAQSYVMYYSKRNNDMRKISDAVMSCKHLRDHVQSTDHNLNELNKLNNRIVKDIENKNKAAKIDERLLRSRKNELRPILPFQRRGTSAK